MNGKTILAVILGTVANFLLGFLIYGVLLMDFMQAHTTEYEGLMKNGSGMMIGYALGSLLFSILLTYVINRANARSARGGLTIAAVISFLYAASLNCMFYFGMNLYSGTYLLVDIVAHTVMGAGTGLVIGAVLSRKKESAA
ncbi:MAG: DUF1761 domain-containing protein [Owenweeksia sp.]|nr:DUF1761 domain-containing protein [Owenweeksia sp.]